MKRLLLRMLLAVAALLGAIAALAVWTVGTESGLRFAWQRAQSFLPYDVYVASIEGRLAGNVVLNDVRVDTGAQRIRIGRVALVWRPSALLEGVFDVERLHLSDLDVTAVPSAQPEEQPEGPPTFPLPERLDLPVAVMLREALLTSFTYRATPEADAQQIVERARVAALLNDDGLLVRELDVQGPMLAVEGRARVLPEDPYETDATIEWVLRPPDYPKATGVTRLLGSLRALDIEQRIERPYGVTAEVRIEQPLEEPTLAARVELAPAIGEIDPELPPASVSATLRLEGAPDDLDVDVRAEAETPETGRVTATLAARYTGDAAIIETLELLHPASGGRLGASGRASLGDPLRVDLVTTWSRLRWPLDGETLARSESGTLEIQGTPNDYAFELMADLAAGDETSGRIRAAGTGRTEAIDLPELEIDVLEGSIVGSAAVRLSPDLAADVDLTVSGINPGVLLTEWPGRLDGRLLASGGLAGESVTVELEQLDLAGPLRDREVDLTTRGQYADETLRLETLALESGSTRIVASGSIAEHVDLGLRVESPNLADLWPGWGGRLTAEGSATGPRMRPRIALDATGTALELPDAEVGELSLTADIDVAGEAASNVELVVADALVAGTAVSELEVTGRGNAQRHELGIAAMTELGETELRLAGTVERPWESDFAWRFELGTAMLAPTGVGAWRLREPSTGVVRADAVELDSTCWQTGEAAGGAALCVQATYGSERTAAAFSLSELPFGYLAALAAQPVQIEGRLNANGTFVSAPDAEPELKVALESSVGRLLPDPDAAEDDAAFDFGPLAATLDAGPRDITANVELPFEQEGRLALSARIGSAAEAAPFDERPLEGRIVADVAGLDFVSDLVDDVENVQGTLNGAFDLSGTVGSPRISGEIALENGAAVLSAANVDIEAVTLAVRGDGSGAIDLSGHAESGGGSLDASGRLSLTPEGPVGTLSATGRAFELIDTIDANIYASPDLRLTLSPERIELVGSVTVPEATLTPRAATGEQAVAASTDEVVVGADETAEAAAARPIYADVRLALGEDVSIEAFGLTGELEGAIELIEAPGDPTTGSGELRVVNGTYAAYGQELEIRTGRLLFAGGPVEHPGLDIEAVRRPAEGILVGARVRGTLEEPELTVFSEPPMQQKEQLSYLVLGRPLQTTSSSEESALSRAALALGLRGGNFVSERINENLGLDEFGIETQPGESPTTASFVIGKYLSPSLYVSYGIGLFEPVSTLKLRYTISERWRLITESSSEGSGGDIIYNIERAGGD